MAMELAKHPRYQHTMHRLEDAKRLNSQGNDYWKARDIHSLLGYDVWDKFVPVIEKAIASIEANGGDSSHHIAQTSKLMEVGGGGKRRGKEYFLSRLACYLVAMNGDPSKPEVAGAQAYFAFQTRVSELTATEIADHKRLATRERLSQALKRVGDIAKDVGVQRYGLFHDARYQGLYGMGAKKVGRRKGLAEGEVLLDRAAPLELSAHEFQANLASEKILNDRIFGEAQAIAVNREIAKDVRDLVIRKTGTRPEDLPLDPDPISIVQKRVKQRKALPKS